MLQKEKTEGLCGQLNEELRRFSPGSRFYSMRQLMLRYHVSRRVVDAALAKLERDSVRDLKKTPITGEGK